MSFGYSPLDLQYKTVISNRKSLADGTGGRFQPLVLHLGPGVQYGSGSAIPIKGKDTISTCEAFK
jgi:hypothetical protein